MSGVVDVQDGSRSVLVDGDDGYDEARSLWNGDHDRRPAVIAQCTTAEQVAAAIAFARAEGLEIAVRGGGHNFAGHGCCRRRPDDRPQRA